jgi:dipeptidyl aminopeptidase/acylaminoacyl peptidase
VIYSSSKDGRRHVVASSHSTQPVQWYILDETFNRLTWIADNYPALDPKALAVPVYVTFKARDGTVLYGYLTRPPHDERRIPLIVLPHGGPAARDDGTFDYWVQFFVSRGWAVLQVNFRGSSGYGVTFTEAGFKRWGLEMQDDLTDGVQYIVEQGIADRNRICIVGGSYGGYATLMGIIKTPDLYRCAVSFAGVSDLSALLDERRNFINYQIGWERQLGSAWSDRQRLKETSPINRADKMRTPLLLVHGAQDRVVLVEQSREMAKSLKKAGIQTFRYVELPDGDHHLSRAEDRIKFFQELERFLTTHLDGDSTAPPPQETH